MIVIEDVVMKDIQCKKIYSSTGKVCYDKNNPKKEFNSLIIRATYVSEYGEKDTYSN